VAAELNTKNQHYVWRHYLSAWAESRTFCCYRQRDRNLFLTQPKAVASETYFYEIQRLTAEDLKYLDHFVGQATDDGLRKVNREYVQMTQLPFVLRERIKDVGLLPEAQEALEEELRWAERNLIERYHTGIEIKCQDILDALRHGDDTFYADSARCIDFLYFLCVQYFRTANMRDRLGGIPSHMPGHDPQRTANIVNHIHATNLGAALFHERSAYRIVFLHNATATPFIAGDQPVINILDPKVTDDVALYYPLSPNLAMVLAKNAVDRDRHVTRLEVERYNFSVYAKSDDQVYSDNMEYLRSLVAIGKDILPT